MLAIRKSPVKVFFLEAKCSEYSQEINKLDGNAMNVLKWRFPPQSMRTKRKVVLRRWCPRTLTLPVASPSEAAAGSCLKHMRKRRGYHPLPDLVNMQPVEGTVSLIGSLHTAHRLPVCLLKHIDVLHSSSGKINPNIDSIDTTTGIGIGLVLAL